MLTYKESVLRLASSEEMCKGARFRRLQLTGLVEKLLFDDQRVSDCRERPDHLGSERLVGWTNPVNQVLCS
jgi:hypothetical protein